MELVLFFIKGLHLITILGWSSPKISIAYFIGLEDEQKEGRKEGGREGRKEGRKGRRKEITLNGIVEKLEGVVPSHCQLAKST